MAPYCNIITSFDIFKGYQKRVNKNKVFVIFIRYLFIVFE